MESEIVAAAIKGHNFFVLGQAGTGKTKLIKSIEHSLTGLNRNVKMTASTGLAAVAVGGTTLHAFFGISDGRYTDDEIIHKIRNNIDYKRIRDGIISTDTLIIDEVSMISRKVFLQIEVIGRRVREKSMPFGGMQVILAGDFFQLKPVPNHHFNDPGDMILSETLLKSFVPHQFVLTKVYRQNEVELITAVHELSQGLDCSNGTKHMVKSLERPLPPGERPMKLFALNYDVEKVNSDCLLNMNGTMKSYKGIDDGDIRALSRSVAIPVLHLKHTGKAFLERLASGPVVGDGSFVVTLERRGYVEAGAWTPEAVVQYPEAVKQLHRDYLRAGSDVMQTFTFYSSDDKLTFAGNHADQRETVNCENLNRAACDLAREVADEGGALVAGGLSPVPGYVESKGKDHVMGEFMKQMEVFKEKKIDFLLGEFFGYIEEAEWAIEAMKTMHLPIACSMRVGPAGDLSGVTPQECAIRMAQAGADVVGVNCNYDPFISLETLEMMKIALKEAGSDVYLMVQPVGWHTQEIRDDERGYTVLPEYPLAMEPRLLTRIDVARFAREAYNLGVRYIGGCCGFEPYHIRAIAEELAVERGVRPPGKDKHGGYESMKKSSLDNQTDRCTREYWENLTPATGRKNVKLLANIVPRENGQQR